METWGSCEQRKKNIYEKTDNTHLLRLLLIALLRLLLIALLRLLLIALLRLLLIALLRLLLIALLRILLREALLLRGAHARRSAGPQLLHRRGRRELQGVVAAHYALAGHLHGRQRLEHHPRRYHNGLDLQAP